MKYLKHITFIAVTALVLVGCNLNEVPKFDDKDAFVAFVSTEASVNEADGSLSIPVMLTSLKGLSSTVYYTVTSGTAVEGTHFSVAGTGTLTFDANTTMNNINVSVVDNEVFEGDISFTIELTDAGSVDFGTKKVCTVKIVDDEHPLAFILGEFTASAYSYFDEDVVWQVATTKDENDINKIWFYPLVLGGSSLSVYGIVNEDKTQLRIPVGQEIATSASYPAILLNGFYGPDGAVKIPTGGYITVDIAANGTMTFQDEFGSQVFSDEAGTVSLGWYNIFAAGVEFVKN